MIDVKTRSKLVRIILARSPKRRKSAMLYKPRSLSRLAWDSVSSMPDELYSSKMTGKHFSQLAA